MNADDMERLFNPRSLVLFNDNEDLSIPASRPMSHLISWGYGGSVSQVVKGSDSKWIGWDEVLKLPSPPDVAMIFLPPCDAVLALELSASAGIGFVIIFSTFREGCEWNRYFKALAMAKKAGTRVLGPDCQGLANFAARIPLSWSGALDGVHWTDGFVALISQSGAFGFSAYAMAAESGVRFRYVVTTGLSSDLDVVDIGRWMMKDRNLRLMVFYLEGVPSGRDFLKMVGDAHGLGISVAVMRGGLSPCARHLVLERHGPGSVADDGAWRAAAKQFGLVLLDGLEEMIDLASMMAVSRRPRGNKVAILSVSGGLGMIQADKCASAGLDVVSLSENTKGLLSRCLPAGVCGANPVDLTADSLIKPKNISQALEILGEAPEVDMVIVAIPVLSAGEAEKTADSLMGIPRSCPKPVACCWLTDYGHGGHAIERLRRSGMPVFESPRRCANAMVSFLKTAVPPSERKLSCFPINRPLLDLYPDHMNGHDASLFVQSYGLSMIKQHFCRNLEEVLRAGNNIGYPVVIKVVSSGIFSKNEARGIALNLRTDEELQNAYGRVLERAARFSPGAVMDGVLVQEMVTDGIECMIGMKRDPVFGPMVAVGLGGILYDVTKDLSLRLTPIDFSMALEMVENLKGYPLFAGMRGSKALDFRSLAAEMVKISDLSCAEPDLLLLDIGLVFVTPKGVKIADVYAKKRGGG